MERGPAFADDVDVNPDTTGPATEDRILGVHGERC